jgi:anti-anti-sigma factor
MKIDKEIKNGYVILLLEGELNFYNISELKEALQEVTQAKNRSLVLDMKLVSYIDSNALGVIHNARTKLLSVNKDLYINNLSPELQEILRIMGLSFPEMRVD